MIKLKQDKPTRDLSKNTQLVKDALGFTETHSQDADRKRGVKHPASDK